ncbi:MAG TPA: hypothetical protein VL358_10360 [Caulobacteraceae bacterium]|jgi:hypothetical protein|nr:hypothetical protein [Caulobacteraceae bacterium]
MDGLFSANDMKLKNIKFCRGSGDVISPEELRAEAHSALLQHRTKSSVASLDAPRSKQPTVDLGEIFADL